MAGVSCFVRLLALFPVFHLESRKQAFLCPNKTLQDKEIMEEQMETYQELRTRQQKEVDALPLGFAFSEKQFEEMKAKLNSEMPEFLEKIRKEVQEKKAKEEQTRREAEIKAAEEKLRREELAKKAAVKKEAQEQKDAQGQFELF